MRDELFKNKEFYIISRNIDNAERCYITDIYDDCFRIKLKNYRKYEVDEAVELFSITEKGQFYFETIVKEVENDILLIWLPITTKYLQRREFSRIKSDKLIALKSGNISINSEIFDISAGGLKVKTKEQLELLKDYDVSIPIENKEISVKFQPIRIEAVGSEFISSGKFSDISNYDRIALVQYCFRKQMENHTI